ncbi:MAG: polymer-forming cytoskeletal protein [Gemmatimonadaceae bacterium]
MRRLIAFAVLALGSSRLAAQVRPEDPAKAVAVQAGADSSLSREIAQRKAAGDTNLPDADHFTFGNRTIASGTSVDGPIAVAHGVLDVYGTINGDAVVVDGTIRIHTGARVTGDAWAAAGTVVIEGGVVEGAKRAIAIATPTLPKSAPREPLTTWQSVKLVIGWFAIMAIIGLGVMVFAEGNLDGVVIALERGFAKSFWIGLSGQVVMLPALLILVVGLGITVLGILLIPFAIVAYVIAVAGLVTLGLLAVARLAGGAMASDRGTTSPRGVHLRALILGLGVGLVLWMLAALFTWNPMLGAVTRGLAFIVTWVAATVGLGAALTSRAGTKRPGVGTTAGKDDELSWQTPTPVAGVAAATRRVVATK